jgi:phospholipid/cholesterol/gamma-HCH transport system ATP-binding protein
MIAIQIRNLTFDVPTKRVLNDINLDIEKGKIISIMGASGSGKTTLLKLICGLLRPTSGQILVEGEDITRMSEIELDRVRLKMGLVFQYAALFDSLNVYDNIVFGVVRNRRRPPRKELDKLVHDLLEEVRLPGIEKQFPSELSGGMRKRVGLARALAIQPTLLFYDEPTSGLDPVTAYAIDELIVETRDRFGVTSVVVSHHIPSIFRISDRVAMLHQGEIAAVGPPAEVENSPDPVVQAFLKPEAAAKQEQVPS